MADWSEKIVIADKSVSVSMVTEAWNRGGTLINDNGKTVVVNGVTSNASETEQKHGFYLGYFITNSPYQTKNGKNRINTPYGVYYITNPVGNTTQLNQYWVETGYGGGVKVTINSETTILSFAKQTPMSALLNPNSDFWKYISTFMSGDMSCKMYGKYFKDNNTIIAYNNDHTLKQWNIKENRYFINIDKENEKSAIFAVYTDDNKINYQMFLASDKIRDDLELYTTLKMGATIYIYHIHNSKPIFNMADEWYPNLTIVEASGEDDSNILYLDSTYWKNLQDLDNLSSELCRCIEKVFYNKPIPPKPDLYKIYNATLKDVAYSIRFATKNPQKEIQFDSYENILNCLNDIQNTKCKQDPSEVSIMNNLTLNYNYAASDRNEYFRNITPGGHPVQPVYSCMTGWNHYLNYNIKTPLYTDRYTTIWNYGDNRDLFNFPIFISGYFTKELNSSSGDGGKFLQNDFNDIYRFEYANCHYIPHMSNFFPQSETHIYSYGMLINYKDDFTLNDAINELNNMFLLYGFDMWLDYSSNMFYYPSPYSWRSLNSTGYGNMVSLNNSLNYPITSLGRTSISSNWGNGINEMFLPYRAGNLFASFQRFKDLTDIYGYENSYIPAQTEYAFANSQNLQNLGIKNFIINRRMRYDSDSYTNLFDGCFSDCISLKDTFNIIPETENDFLFLNSEHRSDYEYSHILSGTFYNCRNITTGVNVLADIVSEIGVRIGSTYSNCSIDTLGTFKNIFSNNGGISIYGSSSTDVIYGYHFNHLTAKWPIYLSLEIYPKHPDISQKELKEPTKIEGSVYSEEGYITFYASWTSGGKYEGNAYSNLSYNLYAEKANIYFSCEGANCVGGNIYALAPERANVSFYARCNYSSRLNIFLLNTSKIREQWISYYEQNGYMPECGNTGELKGTFKKINDTTYCSEYGNLYYYFIDKVPFKYLKPNDWRTMYD